MLRAATLAAIAIAATSFVERAGAATLVTGGSAAIEVTYPLSDLGLWGTAASGSPPATINDAGNPVIELPNQASRGDDFTSGSQVIAGGYDLRLNGGIYLFPLDGDGNELESFDGDGNRLCCRNSLSSLRVNTVTGEITGRINGVRDRDPKYDLLFTLGDTTDAGTEILVSDGLAELLSYAYSPFNSEDFPLINEWVNRDGIPDLAGASVGYLNYSVETAPAPVPVPAALPLLLGGLGLMGVVGARRKRA